MIKILGIDPGLAKCGWAILQSFDCKEDVNYIDSGLFKTNSQQSLYVRYLHIFNFFDELISKYDINKSVIENTFVNSNSKSSLYLFGARTSIALALQKNNIEIKEFAATKIKKIITGNGHADKISVFKILRLLMKNLPEKFISDDCSDAVAISYCGFWN